jgi:hypothetical protein
MRFLRTAPPRRLLAVIGAVLGLAVAGAAIAVAATGGGPVPPRASLARAVHGALVAAPVAGVSADITFTDNLIDSADFTGQATDPLLQGASGRLWIGGGRMRLELQSVSGDAQVVVDHRAFWVSDPAQNVVYEGTLPASRRRRRADSVDGVPTVGRIRSMLSQLMDRVGLSGAVPTDVAGRAAYQVTVSPTTTGGLVGSAELAWDAANGVPLSFSVDARGDSTPVLGLTASHISYGAVPASDFDITPPAGSRVVRLGALGGGAATHAGDSAPAPLAFTLDAPSSLAGLPRHAVRRLGTGAVVSYGSGPGAIAVLESAHRAAAAAPRGSVDGLSLPTVSLPGATGTELSTQLGTVIRFTRDGIDFTILGSVPAATAQSAARGL